MTAPATSGNEIWERHFRVQQNSVEQLLVFLPTLWVFGTYASAPIGAGIGLVFIIGRALYAIGYVAEPSKRTAGFVIGFLSNATLVIGGAEDRLSADYPAAARHVAQSLQNAELVVFPGVGHAPAFEIPDEFVVGYGIDYAQRNRNLPFIGKVKRLT